MTPPLVYVADKYRAPTAWQLEQNIRAAEALAFEVAKLGGYPVTPHACTRGYFESARAADDHAFWLEATLELMRRCDAVLMGPTWRESKGARGEYEEAKRLGLPVFEQLDALRDWLIGREASHAR